jgi:hypothetical protein
MTEKQHRIGVDSQDPYTDVVFDGNTSLVRSAVMKGKFPNGLAEAGLRMVSAR